MIICDETPALLTGYVVGIQRTLGHDFFHLDVIEKREPVSGADGYQLPLQKKRISRFYRTTNAHRITIQQGDGERGQERKARAPAITWACKASAVTEAGGLSWRTQSG